MDIARKISHVDGDPPLKMKRPREPLRQQFKHQVSGAFDVPDVSLANGRLLMNKSIFPKSTVSEVSAPQSDGIPTAVPRRPRTGCTKPRAIAVEKCVFSSSNQVLPRNGSSPLHSEPQSPRYDDDSEEQMAEALLDLANAFNCPPPVRLTNHDVRLPVAHDDKQPEPDTSQVNHVKSDVRPKKKARHNLAFPQQKFSNDSRESHQKSPVNDAQNETQTTSPGEVDKGVCTAGYKSSEDQTQGWPQEVSTRKSSSSGARSPGRVSLPTKTSEEAGVITQSKKHKEQKRSSNGDRSVVSGSELSNSSAGTRQDAVVDAAKPSTGSKSFFKRCALHVYIAHFIAEQQKLEQQNCPGASDTSKRPKSSPETTASPKGHLPGLKVSPASHVKQASAKLAQPMYPQFKHVDKQEVDSKPQPAMSLPFTAAAAAAVAANPLSFLPGLFPHPSLPHLPPVSVPLSCSMPMNPAHLPPQFPPLNLMQHAGHPFPLFPGFHHPQGFPSAGVGNPLAAQAAAAAAAAAPFMGAPHFPFAGVLPPHLPAPLAVSAALSAQIRPDLGFLTRSFDVKDVERSAAKFPLMDEIVENLLLRGRRV